MTELIICEKPMAAKRIATTLSDTKPKKNTKGKSVYYEITHKRKKIYVGCAVGHLFGLAENKKYKWEEYPVFDVSWKPKFEFEKNMDYTESYLNLLKNLAKKADTITIATDYDVEGAVIGYTIVKYGLKRGHAKRMKFSTLTKDELISSYENSKKNLDFNLVKAGITRHHLDWFYGINLTKALSASLKHYKGLFRVLSTGRVQGPTLKIIVDREDDIKKFVAKKYWEIYLDGLFKKNRILAKHKSDKFSDKNKVKEILKKTKGKKAVVKDVRKTTPYQSPPIPFDLTTLQTEAYRHLNLTPKHTSNLAQELYISGLISYPRTSSQKLPPSIGYEKILRRLEKRYPKECKFLLQKKLKPNEGKKTDPAHPAIYPTGEFSSISGKKLQLYNLIVRRFLAVFGDPAKRLTTSVDIDVNNELFHLTGTTTLNPGWHTLYGRFAIFKEEELPLLNIGDEIKVKKVFDEEKETQPPKRYTQASIIKELERRRLGTKATRHLILDTLYSRNYIENQPIETTELGEKLVKTLKKYSPEIIDEKLTREFEDDMEGIKNGRMKKEKIIDNSKKVLTKILNNIKHHEKNIGKELTEATIHTQQKLNELGSCHVCKKGILRILFSRNKKRFVACNQYPKCKTTYSLPQSGLIKHTEKLCKHDDFPQVLVIRQGKRPWMLCLNPDCPRKLEWKNSHYNNA